MWVDAADGFLVDALDWTPDRGSPSDLADEGLAVPLDPTSDFIELGLDLLDTDEL